MSKPRRSVVSTPPKKWMIPSEEYGVILTSSFGEAVKGLGVVHSIVIGESPTRGAVRLARKSIMGILEAEYGAGIATRPIHSVGDNETDGVAFPNSVGNIQDLILAPSGLEAAVSCILKIRKGCEDALNSALGEQASGIDPNAKGAFVKEMMKLNYNLAFQGKSGGSDVLIDTSKIFSNFFNRKSEFFKPHELEIKGEGDALKDKIIGVFNAMEIFPESLHRLAKDNTQFPAELVERNKDKLSIENITEIGARLLEIKKSQQGHDSDAKNPEQSESMKQIANILKAKIKTEEKAGRPVSEEVKIAATEFIDKVKSTPSPDCTVTAATKAVGERSVFEKFGDKAKGFVDKVVASRAAEARGDGARVV